MRKYKAVPRKTMLASALLLAVAAPSWAQDSTEASSARSQDPDPATLDTVMVTGIRGSLTSSMNLKRDSQGVVDGIVAEDIGKFPDTNLAESLQRISGVSIDRTSSGEGSKVTVRGIGPDYNLVLLNGRQMPASNLGDGGAGLSGSRSFDFANIASESISAVEVYKTTRADNPTGGIGATINIKTLRPLESEPVISVGLKAINDSSNGNLPRTLRGSELTGEMSGIFSNTYADGRFGVALSASHQERDSGFNQATVAEGWATFQGDETEDGRALPLPGQGYADRIQNRPGADDVYGRPQNTAYNVNGVQRQRTNAQATFQWKPADNVTTTLDYTHVENKVQQQRSELSVWFNYGPGDSTWTNGPVAAPIIYSEDMEYSDLSMGGAKLATKNTMDSLGFNVEWEVNDALDLSFDYHNSSAESQPDSPYGSAGVLGVAAFVRGTTTVDYSGDLPIINVALPPGRTQVEASDALVTGSVFQNSYNKSEVEQFQARGRFKFANYSALDFGIGSTEVQNRSASAIEQRNSWGGLGTPGDYDDSIWYADDMAKYFKAFSGSGDPRMTGRFLVFDFDRLRERAGEVGTASDPACPTCYFAPTEYSEDIRTTEKSKSAYLQYRTTFDWSMPLNVAVGVRYEKTEVESSAMVRVPDGISWSSANEFNIDYATESGVIDGRGEYDYFLPNVDLKLDISDALALRGSYSRSIGRPGWTQIQSGQTLADIVRTQGGTGSRGNPGLEPLLSDNFDLSLEWYYGESSYASVGYFRKNIKNFISNTILREEPGNLHTPVGGTYWNEALASGCGATDMPCIRDFIFTNHDGDPGVTATGTNSAGQLTGTIVGQPGDPVAGFDITVPANQRSDHLDGWEVSVQHLFGQSGFGLAANYTKVKSGLTFNNLSLGDQYPMIGLSDSANLVAFYDKNAWQVRAAYNWRDSFLNGIGGQGPNPNYTEAYGQLDVNISYAVTPQLSLSLEGINLTDETMRTYARHSNMLRYATQTGPRYMFGVRYKF
ncbi:TonB-dependent receptor [Stenotrophomonas tumulicola]|uniref:TonB-dependent receptor n=1 Tax=Stenotrophomonas tumulicola TaxID=1685415 RepID=A0A7W3IGY6_9GAMM|nr:TonB-dependent receptor [Stenotrophomonas tumulicola]MBA8681307.1 TonB-dependent receptor [Stenotrophomonas tumulicola]